MDDEEVKIILIKLLGVLGKSLENKVIIGQNDGFRKLLGLMLEQNEDLLKGIIDAFKQFLDITPEKDELIPTKPVSAPDITSLTPAELRSIFDPLQDESSPGAIKQTKNLQILSEVSRPEERPTYDALQRMSIEIKKEEEKRSLERTGELEKGEESKNRMTCLTLFKHYSDEKLPFEEMKGDAVAEEMVIQGTLNTLKEILLTTKHELQIDLMQIIAKLLIKSTYNQSEFRKIEGYFVLAVMLNQKRDCTDVNERKYLRTCMQILKRIIYSDDERKVIKNMDAFKVLLSLISSSQQLLTVSEALVLLNEILRSDARNCLIFYKMLGFVDLHILLLRLLFPETEYENLLKSQFCVKNSITKLTALTNYQLKRHEELVTSKTFGEGTKKVTETYENTAVSEKDKIELFTLNDQLLMSLCFVLTPLHIMPCAAIYSHILTFPQLRPQFDKCLLDRLEVIVVEKFTKTSVENYEQTYCADLESSIANLSMLVQNLSKSLNKNTQYQEIFSNSLEIFHKYLQFAAILQYYVKPDDAKLRNHLISLYENLPEILEFLYSLLNTTYADNPYYRELIYSTLEMILFSSQPNEPLLKFFESLLSNSAKWKYQDLLLIDSICASQIIAENLGTTNPTILTDFLGKSKNSLEKLSKVFIVHMLCRDSYKNKVLLEEKINPLSMIKDFGYTELKENEQFFVLCVFRALTNSGAELKHNLDDLLDYSLVIPGVDQRDIELVNNVRNEMKAGYKSILGKVKPKIINGLQNRNRFSNIRNTFITLLIESALSIQLKMIPLLVEDLNESLDLCFQWLQSETLDIFLEAYISLEDGELKAGYLKILKKLLSKGISSNKPELIHKLIKTSQEFQEIIRDILEIEDPPAYLSIDKEQGADPEKPGCIYTAPLKYFSKEKTGFTVTFWVKYPFIAPNTTFFEFVDTGDFKEKPMLGFKYLVAPLNVPPKKEEDNSGGSSRGSSRGGIMKHYFVIENEGTSVKNELEVPVLEADKLTHMVIEYNKNTCAWYVNGKLIFATKSGTINPYPMVNAKNLRLKLTSQVKIISPITVYEGIMDAKNIANLWLKGILDEFNMQKENIIDLPKIYKFPKICKEPNSSEIPFEKIITLSGKNPEKGIQSRNFPFSICLSKCIQPQYIEKLKYINENEYQTANTKTLKTQDYFETFGPISAKICSSFTLKEFLSTPDFINTLLSVLPQAKPKEFCTLLEIIGLLVLRNEKFSLQIKDIKLPLALINISLTRKNTLTDSIEDLHAILGLLFDLLCSQTNTLKDLNVFTKPNILNIPILHSPRVEYFKSIQDFMIISQQAQREIILTVLSNLLTRQENAEKLAAEGLQSMLLYLLKEACEKKSDSDSFMYEKLLEVFQLFFHWPHMLDWDLLFSFFLLLKFKETPGAHDVLTDLLSIFSVYILISTNKCALAEKFINVGGLKVIFLFKLI